MTDSDPVPFGSSALRVGTAERERAAAALGEHFAAGRLEVDEYDERVARAYAAKTAAELAVLFADLPQPAPPPTPPPPVARQVRGPAPLVPVAVIVALVSVVVLVATTHIVPLVLFPVLLIVLIRGRQGWGPGYRGRSRRYYRM